MSNGGAVVVVGGTRAIGLELARRYATEGAEVVISGRSDEHLSAAVDELTRSGATVRGLSFDLAQPESISGVSPWNSSAMRRSNANWRWQRAQVSRCCSTSARSFGSSWPVAYHGSNSSASS